MKPLSQAQRADKYKLYLRAVQAPDHEANFAARAYRSYYSRPALNFREDFCGTAAICCEWIKAGGRGATCGGRTAYGVDLDPEPLAWGREHNIAKLTPAQQQSITLAKHDVRDIRGPKADVIAALNFSFCIFKTRAELREYFAAARKNMAREGLLVLDMMGGWESYQEGHSDFRTLPGGAKYVWEQARFDPITHHGRFHIHFQFKDGSTINRAFTYDWRLWSIPELKELMIEAGFRRADVYWEGTNRRNGQGDGIWRRREHAEADQAWIAIIVGAK